MLRIIFVLFLFALFLQAGESQNILHVGNGRTYSNPAQAAAVAKPGDTILIHPGTYRGPYYIEFLQGRHDAWITIKGTDRDLVLFDGGTESMHFSDINYIALSNFTVKGQTGNGMNIDDGGTIPTPAHNVRIENCIFRDISATGNNDLLKLSGLDSFRIVNCIFENGSAGGSGIDMVGCHQGIIEKSLFRNQGSNSIQAKGASSELQIRQNQFISGGQRSLNLGGSTGSAFFRPAGANYEARNLLVYSNIFQGGMTPIAFVGCREVKVINNTILQPEKWILRILQESSDTSFYLSCANNTFANNIVVVTNTLSTDVNIGPNTSPGSFQFKNNLWYHLQNSGWRGPQLPVIEMNGIIQRDPLFINMSTADYQLKPNSPAIGKGLFIPQAAQDYQGKSYLNPPSIGAFEGGQLVRAADLNEHSFPAFPNPFNEYILLSDLTAGSRVELLQLNGLSVRAMVASDNPSHLNTRDLAPGFYILKVHTPNKSYSRLLEKLP